MWSTTSNSIGSRQRGVGWIEAYTLGILNDINFVQREAKVSTDRFKNYAAASVGLELLYLFMMDTLGRNTYKAVIFIFRNKYNQDFQQLPCVSHRHQTVGWLFIVLLNIILFVYCVILSHQHDMEWQLSLLNGWLYQFLMEIMLVESVEAICMHVFVPCIIFSDVMNTIKSLHELVAATLDNSIE